jgi:hypothetical protein
MTPRDRWKEIEVILNSALDKTEAERVVSLLKESVKYEAINAFNEETRKK